MKSANYKFILTMAVACTMAVGAVAEDNLAANPVLGVLSTAKAIELPAKAAELVAKADAKSLKQTTIDVVKAAVGLNPAGAPIIVGTIAHASPAMAATASATAVGLVPNQVLAIARAAAAACPTKAGEIVEAICRVLPADYQAVAMAVAEVVPGAGREILAGISTAIPQLKTTIDQTLASYQGSIPSVSTVLSQVAQTDTSAGLAALATGSPGASPSPAGVTPSPILPRGPSTGTPFVPISGTPIVITPGAGGQVPTGGGDYTAP